MMNEGKYRCGYCNTLYKTLQERTRCELKCQAEQEKAAKTDKIKELRETRNTLSAQEKSLRRQIKKLEQQIENTDAKIAALSQPTKKCGKCDCGKSTYSVNGVEVTQNEYDDAIRAFWKAIGLI